MSRTLRVDSVTPQSDVIEAAAAIIRAGGLVAFPTETVYGLGANALDESAVRKIFEAKERPSFNPLIAHVADAHGARGIVSAWPDAAELLASRFWPGPLTLVLPRNPIVPDILSAGLSTVAVRVPAHPVAHALLTAAGLPIAAPSANRFTRLSPTTAAHVEKALGDRADLILDGGPTPVGIESTVVDLSGPTPILLRPGSIGLSLLQEVLGPVRVSGEISGLAPRPAPGMVERHYSPRARLLLFGRESRSEMAETAHEAKRRGERVGAILLAPLDVSVDDCALLPDDPAAYARDLYAALHRLDDAGCDLILMDSVPDDAEWAGVRDRLTRASR